MHGIIEYRVSLFLGTISVVAFCVFWLTYEIVDPEKGVREIFEEHQIIQAVFDSDSVLIFEETIKFKEEQKGKVFKDEENNGLEFATWECLQNANKNVLLIKQDLLPKENILIYNIEWLEEVKKSGDYLEMLYKQGYYGVNKISRVCFNQARSKAIIYTSNYCGALCGGASVIMVIFKDGRWQKEGTQVIWVS